MLYEAVSIDKKGATIKDRGTGLIKTVTLLEEYNNLLLKNEIVGGNSAQEAIVENGIVLYADASLEVFLNRTLKLAV